VRPNNYRPAACCRRAVCLSRQTGRLSGNVVQAVYYYVNSYGYYDAVHAAAHLKYSFITSLFYHTPFPGICQEKIHRFSIAFAAGA